MKNFKQLLMLMGLTIGAISLFNLIPTASAEISLTGVNIKEGSSSMHTLYYVISALGFISLPVSFTCLVLILIQAFRMSWKEGLLVWFVPFYIFFFIVKHYKGRKVLITLGLLMIFLVLLGYAVINVYLMDQVPHFRT